MPVQPEKNPSPSLPRRLAAIFYDCLLLLALWLAANALILALSGGMLAAPERPDWLLYVQRTALIGVTFGFFAWFWVHGGQTLGMRVWRLRLYALHGGPVEPKQAALRLLAAPFSIAVLGLGYIWVLIDRERRTWHGRISGTRLVLLPQAAQKR